MNKQTYINIYRSIYDSIFSSILRLSNLKVLEVRENRLKTLPKSLCRLTALERLDVGTNLFEIFVSRRRNRIEFVYFMIYYSYFFIARSDLFAC